MKPYYEHAGITIYHGDARDVLPQIASAEIVLTDPPYGICKVPRTYARRGSTPVDWDSEFPTWWLDEAARIAPVLGIMPGVANLPRCPMTIGRLRYCWTLAVHVVNGMTRGVVGYGNWIPCMLYAAEGVSLYRQLGDAVGIAVSAGEKPSHPSPKPLGAMRWIVSRLPSGNIVDPFMGSGTTLLAAKELGHSAIGIEIEERYCEIAARRLAQEVLL